MDLLSQLVAYYSFEELFDQAISAVNSVPPNAMPLLAVNDAGGGTGLIFTRSVTGKVGKGAGGYEANSSVSLQSDGENPIAILDKSKTFAFWIKLFSDKQENTIMGKGVSSVEYGFTVDVATSKWALFSNTQTILYPTVPVLDQWYLVIWWYDVSTGKAYLKVDDGLPVSGTFTVALQPGTSFVAVVGAVEMDELGIWDRILTGAEMDFLRNGGPGVSYQDIVEESSPSPCRTLECCADNPAAYTSVGGEGKGYDSACEPLPKVLFEPTSGTRVIMPSLVLLRSDNPDAVIHYTTDGTAPDRNSPVYSTPIEVDSPADLIQAIAIVEGCPEGPQASAQYQQWSPAAHFTYGCGVVDKSGQWGAFTGDGNADYNWQLQIQFSAITAIKVIEVLQLFPDGTFTGAAWATKEFIYPWPDDAAKQHRAFPLVLWNPDHTGAQVNVAYQDDFSAAYGNFGVGAHTRTLYGSPWTSIPASHLFKLRITFADGSLLERIVDSTCDALPATLCPVPVITGAGQICGPPKALTIDYALGVGTALKIFRATSPSGPFTEIFSGVVGASPETYQDQTIVVDTDYYYYISNIPAGCFAYLSSSVVAVSGIYSPIVSISATPSIIAVGGSTTIAWNSQNIGGLDVTITPTIGLKPGNVAGNQVVAPVVTTVYTIQGDNFCGDSASAQVTVTVLPSASCGGSQLNRAQISGYFDGFFSDSACGGLNSSAGPVWPGYLVKYETPACYWSTPDGWSINGATLLGDPFTKLEIVAGKWQLDVYAQAVGAVLIWRGTKAFGDTPAGVYNRTFGCSATPSVLTIVMSA